MTKERDALKLALAVHSKNESHRTVAETRYWCEQYKLLAQKAIEVLAQPEQEPVAWMHWLHGPVQLFLNKDEAMLELKRLNRDYPVDGEHRKMRPLVFGDTTPPQRKPLTDEQIGAIDELMKLNTVMMLPMEYFMRVVRAVEAAHGIKE